MSISTTNQVFSRVLKLGALLIAAIAVIGGAIGYAVAGANGLTRPAYALVDQLRSIDKQRIRRRYGQESEAELAAINAGLRLYLGLEPDPG